MFSKTVFNFLYALLTSDKKISEIIGSIGYSERFVVALDFEIMHKMMINGLSNMDGEVGSLNADVKIWTDFVKNLLTSEKSLEILINSYSDEQRHFIAKIMSNLQGQLLDKVRQYVDASELQACNSEISH